ncbi:hypothetical protein DFH94DRAFT_163201 [Russula ochroleuca]|uniref:Uncharacterized protein n=1 Tax=Russula ochroleuca TaxID=152965 RepID=A0A9P5TDM9_9AGAM|nr:hypothetical protein DFH94DRAFT_163201 [Russula ochroleuca]
MRPSSNRTSLPLGPNPKFSATALFRRFSNPSTYSTNGNALGGQPAALPPIDPTSIIHNQVHDASLYPANPPSTVHEYNLKSRGKDYALIIVTSHALDVHDTPLLYFGEEIKGYVMLSRTDLSDMQSMDVVLQVFDSDNIIPSFEVKRVLLSQQVDDSHTSNGYFCWPFALLPPADSIPSSGSSADSSYGHQSSFSHGTDSDLKFQLIVTISRRGRLNRNVGVKQKIFYVPPPDHPVLRSSPAQISISLPDTTTTSSWTQQRLPPVGMKGLLHGQVYVEVECKLIMPREYPIGNTIPLRIVLTSENHEALDLFSPSHVIDVRLHKVVAFGDRAGAVRPLSLKDHDAFHRVELVAKAKWELPDTQAKELPPNGQHRRPRWRVKINGTLQRNPDVELCPSYEEPGVSMAIVYFVGLFPFRVAEFIPDRRSNKELAIGKINLTKPPKPDARPAS